ncbi:unnamed protein product [Rhizophagus irregularis]|nr:unnamed protein product [Rhizophagus irregularis]
MDNEIVQPIYFEEINNASEKQSSGYEESDTDDEIVNVNEVTLKIGDFFNDWESVQVIIDSYAKQNGLHRECTSYKTGCPWKASFYLGKNTNLIRLATFIEEHNHQCDPKTIEFAPKNLRLPQQIIDKIEHYTTNGNLGAEQQYKLLVQEFPQHNIAKKNLYNAIQKFQGVRIHDETDAATMLLYLLKQREDDPDYVVIPRLEGPANELTGLFWMTSYQCNDLWPKFHDVIVYDTTSKTNRYEMALSLFVAIDNNYKSRIIAQALTKYENQGDFNWILQCTLLATNDFPPKVLFTDSDPAIIAAVQVVYPQTRHLLCVYHLFENVKKKAKSKLRGDIVSSFVSDFYAMRNSHSEEQFDMKYQEMLSNYEPCRPYLEKRLYPSRESWARYCISKIFTAGVESTQRVESINGIIKKLVDRGTLLKELVELDSVLQANLFAIPLSIQRAQMNQSLLYQANLISIDRVEDNDGNFSDILEHSYDIPQIRLRDLLSGISYNDINELWEVSYIASKISKSHYVVILEDSTILCTCMFIVNQGMICRHQFRVLIQSEKAIFHISHIHARWFKSNLDLSTNFITIANGKRNHTAIPLSYMNQLRTDNVYTPMIREKVNKKIQFGSTMSVAKTCIQIAVTEDVTAELIGILIQFIMKYRRSTGLSIENTGSAVSFSGTESLQDSQGSSIQNYHQPLSILPEISNPEYHKPKGRPPKRYRSVVENNHVTSGKSNDATVQKTCSYCSGKGHNIRGCSKYKAESSANKENEHYE